MNWFCLNTWKISSKNTAWCLLGCSIGDIGTIAFFQIYEIQWPTLIIMTLAIIKGLITSIILETFVLSRQMQLVNAFKIAIGMSLISMISMEVAMNTVDINLTGGAILNPLTILAMLTAGFLFPLPYNYWRLKKLGKNCH